MSRALFVILVYDRDKLGCVDVRWAELDLKSLNEGIKGEECDISPLRHFVELQALSIQIYVSDYTAEKA